MAKSVKGTRTEKNLLTSFAGESQARMRYTYFASVAKKEGYEQIAAIFTETADQEKEHAKRMFKWLELAEKKSDVIKMEQRRDRKSTRLNSSHSH